MDCLGDRNITLCLICMMSLTDSPVQGSKVKDASTTQCSSAATDIPMAEQRGPFLSGLCLGYALGQPKFQLRTSNTWRTALVRIKNQSYSHYRVQMLL